MSEPRENKTDSEKHQADNKTLEIKLTLPALPSFITTSARKATKLVTQNKFTKFVVRKLRAMPARRRKIGFAVVAVILVTAGSVLSREQPPAYDSVSSSTNNATPVLTKGTPDYDTILPKDKDIAVLGGWTRVSPPDGNPVFAYVDTINDKTISVSQQPLPDEFKEDTADQVAQLAQNFNAGERITIDETTVHIGTSSDGPQSLIFHKNNLLILIKSKETIETDQWAAYINSLE